jgi:hypothetical protein
MSAIHDADARKFLNSWYAYVEKHDPALLDGLVADGARYPHPLSTNPRPQRTM